MLKKLEHANIEINVCIYIYLHFSGFSPFTNSIVSSVCPV